MYSNNRFCKRDDVDDDGDVGTWEDQTTCFVCEEEIGWERELVLRTWNVTETRI